MVYDADEGGLSRSVGSEKTVHSARGDAYAYVVEGFVAGIVLAYTDYFKYIVHCMKFCPKLFLYFNLTHITCENFTARQKLSNFVVWH